MKLIYLAAIAAFFFLATSVSKSAEPIKEMAMPTDVGAIILTMQPCPFTPNYGFPYFAYATEKGSHDHLGCWHEPEQLEGKPQNQIININFPEINAVASYNKKLFTPRTPL
jgi:hypothetical protein